VVIETGDRQMTITYADDVSLTIAAIGFAIVAVTFITLGVIGWLSDRRNERVEG
jgi:hypothetical protein